MDKLTTLFRNEIIAMLYQNMDRADAEETLGIVDQLLSNVLLDAPYTTIPTINESIKNMANTFKLDIGDISDEIVVKGITEEDAIALRKLNWMINNDTLACFV